MEKECNLDEFKKEYEELQVKYDLPNFKDLNEDFQIEKIADIETEVLIKEIRKYMAEKFSSYIRFIEALLHPTNSPMFVFSIIKTLGNEEKEVLTEVYKKLAKMEVALVELDIKYEEIKEVNFIKENFELWQYLKRDLLKVIDAIKKRWDDKVEGNNKGYFA